MPECCIGIGKCSYFYIYLLGAFVFNYIKKKIIYLDKLIINRHNLLRQVYKYFGYIIFGLLCNFILNKFLFKKQNNKKIENKKSELIYNAIIKFSKKDIFMSVIVCLINVIYRESINIISYLGFASLMFWNIHIAIILLFMKKYFPENIYKHQIYPMTFAIILITTLKIITTFFNYENNQNIYKVKGTEICILIIFFFILIAFFSSFSDIQIKILIDLKFISSYTIIISIGIIGFLITFISAIVYNFLGDECNSGKKNINCYVSISSYLDELKDKYNDDKIFFTLEILITFFYIINEFLYIIMHIFIIKYLNPTFLMLSDCMYFGINNIINYIDKYNSNDEHYTIKFVFEEISEIIVILAFCFYLEIVELRFCGLNNNTKRNIIFRGEIDNDNDNDNDNGDDSILFNEELNNNEEERNNNIIEML